MRRLLQRLLGSAGYAIHRTDGRYARDGLFTLHSDHFRGDPAFQAAYARGIKASRGVDPQFEWRVHMALWAARTALGVPGDFAECGVNAGFMSSAIMQGVDWNATARRFYLIDTFAGPVMAQYSSEEVRRGRLDVARRAMEAGAYVTDLERVRANFAEWPGAVVVPGAIPEILSAIPPGPVAFLHIDLNSAAPERAALKYFWPRLSPGALVLLDDYGYAGYECQREQMDATARELGRGILSLPTGQGLIAR